jgi:Acyltransferase
MRTDFRPPREHPLLIRLTQAALPLILRARRIVCIHVAEGEWEHLEALRGSRGILSANHPTTNDPLIAFELSRRLGEPFNYLACRDIFDGLYGSLIQRLGAYSILRGLPDREAIRATRRLLAERDRKVVIFPEGETYEHNDLTIPFQQGVTQIGFWAMEDLQKEGREPRLPVLPVAVKYRCARDARGAIDASLRSLEGALCLSRAPGAGFYERLRRVGERVLAAVEAEFGLKSAAGAPLAERVQATKEHVLERVAREVGEGRPAALPLPDQMRAMFNAVAAYADEFAETPGDYGQRQHARRLEAAHLLLRDLWRLQNFLVVTDGYVAERMTAERFLDVLGRLEVEVFGAVRHRVPREAIVRLAPAIDLGQQYEAYQRQKRETVAAVTARVEASVRALLTELAAAGTPIEA